MDRPACRNRERRALFGTSTGCCRLCRTGRPARSPASARGSFGVRATRRCPGAKVGPIGDDDEGAPWLQCGPRVCEKLMAVNEMNCVGESNSRDGTVMVRDRVQVVGRPEDPRDAALATVLIGCADEPERVRFRVHADELADSTH